MRPSIIVLVGIWLPFLPFVVGLARQAARFPTARWLMAWCLGTGVLNLVGVASVSLGNNMWVEHLSLPMDVLLLGATFATGVRGSGPRRAIWWMVASMLVILAIVTFFAESLRSFPAYTGSLRTLLVGGGAAWWLIVLTSRATTPFWRDSPRLFAAGLVLVFIPNLMFEVSFGYLLERQSPLVHPILNGRATFWLFGYSLIAIGMHWHSNLLPSGSPPSPLRSSPSAS